MAKLQELALKYWWIAAIVIAAFLWMKQHDAAVRFQALAESRLIELQNRSALIAKVDSQLAVHDSIVAKQRRELIQTNAKLDAQVTKTNIAIDSGVANLKKTLTVEQNQQIDVLVAHYNSIIVAKDRQIANLRAIISSQDTVIAERDSLKNQLNGLKNDLLEQTQKLTKATQPSKLNKFVQVGTLIVAGIAAFK